MIRGSVVAAACLLLLGGVLPGGAQPRLVKDVDPGVLDPQRVGSGITGLTSIGARAVFLFTRGDDEDSGSELWTTDGTDGGTERLRTFLDLQASVAGSNGRIAFLFVAAPGSPGPVSTTLWRTDGTFAGTFALARFAASGETAVHGGSLVFAGCATANDCEPWTSDGTAAGTRRLRDITPGDYGSAPHGFLSLGDRLFFFATAPDGPGLWQTDLTRGGTRRVALLPPYSVPGELAAAGSHLFFIVGKGNSLWTSDGTPEGTRPLAPFDRSHGRGPAVAQLLGAVGGSEFFSGVDPALGAQLYRTDGTPGGTRRLTSFPRSQAEVSAPLPLVDRLVFAGPGGQLWTSGGTRASTHPLTGCAGGCPTPYSDYRGFGPVESGGRAFFAASLDGDVEPWVTDGTGAGTRRLLQACANGSCGSYPAFGPVIQGRVFFQALQGLWTSDGTAAGTVQVGTNADLMDQQPLRVAASGSRLVFVGFDPGAPAGTDASQLKSTEGTLDSQRILNIPLYDGLGSNPMAFTALGDDVIFFACTQTSGFWKTRGTPETTVELTDARNLCSSGSTTQAFAVLDGVAYFPAYRTGDYWAELWRTDGTPEGTWQVSRVGPDKQVTAAAPFRGRIYFLAEDISGGASPRTSIGSTDGTVAGTSLLFDLPVRYVFGLSAFEDALYFKGEDESEGEEFLYRSDGTAAGTSAVIPVGAEEPSRFIRLGGQLLIADQGSLWKSDGTVGGFRQLENLDGEPQGALDPTPLGDQICFIDFEPPVDPNTSTGPPALFRTDGNSAGTIHLKTFDQDPASYSLPAPQLTPLSGALYFVAFDLEHGGELWRTDGTAAGTVRVTDLNPGPASARISGLTAAGGRLFFAADDGEHGSELWTSDGTAAGTRRLSDIAEGPFSSSPRELTVVGDGLYFSADDGVIGREPWLLPLASPFAGKERP